MKVSPIRLERFTSENITQGNITKNTVHCTSTSTDHVKQGYSNQEIYQGLVNIKNSIASIFTPNKKKTGSLNYLI